MIEGGGGGKIRLGLKSGKEPCYFFYIFHKMPGFRQKSGSERAAL